MEQKSQITVFIVLGIVVLIISGLFFFVSRQASELVLEKKVNKIYKDFLSTTGIKEYASSCLDATTKEAIRLAALQGGKIYDYQAEGGYPIGSINNPSTLEKIVPFEFEEVVYYVSYGIRAPERDCLDPARCLYPKWGDYPYPGILVKNPADVYDPVYTSVFAKEELDNHNRYTLTALCNFYGPNFYIIKDAEFSCATKTLLNTSVQQYLRVFILGGMEKCIDFSKFASKSGYEITRGDITALVLIGNDDISVNIKYPIIISIQGSPPVTKFLEFTSRPVVRLKKIHELALHLIGYRADGRKPEADADNIFFDITKDDPADCAGNENGKCILEGMNVSKSKDYCLNNLNNNNNLLCKEIDDKDLKHHYKYSDIIDITDGESKIDGKPLHFLFAVENRAPALSNTNTGSMNIRKNDVFFFVAHDPDEDPANDDSELGYELKRKGSDGLYHDLSEFSPLVFTESEDNKFTADTTGNYEVLINVSDNEGLYDYEELIIYVV